jgi:1-pyrroline-5-carboxylate dehydrogenase
LLKTAYRKAIANALESAWASMAWEQRAAIFLKAAELIAGPYRARINAATMIGNLKMFIKQKLMLVTIDFYVLM